MSGYLNSNPYCVFVYVFQSEVCVVANWLAGLFCIYTYAPPPRMRTAISARRRGEIKPLGEVFIGESVARPYEAERLTPCEPFEYAVESMFSSTRFPNY